MCDPSRGGMGMRLKAASPRFISTLMSRKTMRVLEKVV
jgi:hypothetical protein